MMFGMLVFMLAAEFLMMPLGLVNQKLNLGLTTLVVIPAGVPVLGGMTAFLLLYFAAILGLWILLLKLNIIPRDPFGVKAAQRTRTQQAAAASTTRRPGGPRTRAERRHDATVATTASTKGSEKETSKSASGTRNVATSAVRVGQPGKHDDAYERARTAAQRKRRAGRK
jgi:hypothetical protein